MDQGGLISPLGKSGKHGRENGHRTGSDEVPQTPLQVKSKNLHVSPFKLGFIVALSRFRDLYNWPEKRHVALDTFEKNKNSMMQVAVQGLEKDLKLKP